MVAHLGYNAVYYSLISYVPIVSKVQYFQLFFVFLSTKFRLTV